MIGNLINDKEKELREKTKAEGKSFLGAKACAEVNIFDSPKTPQKLYVDQDGNINPRVSCASKALKEKLLDAIDVFINEYRYCLEKFKRGIRDVLFPPGTYKMKVTYDLQAECQSFGELCMSLSTA